MLEHSACVCTVWVQLRLRWGSLVVVVVVELAGGGRGPRPRVPPGHHLGVPPVPRPRVPPTTPPPPPTTPHYPHQPLASLRHRRGVYLSPTSTSPQHAPRFSWMVGKTKIVPVLPFYPIVCNTHCVSVHCHFLKIQLSPNS